MRGIFIDPEKGWWEERDPKDTEEIKEMLGAEFLENPALKVGGEYFGCYCDRDAREHETHPDTVVMRIRKGFRKRHRYFGYVAGPVFIYLNRGLDDIEVEFLRRRIFLHEDAARTPFLLVEDFQDMLYEESDP